MEYCPQCGLHKSDHDREFCNFTWIESMSSRIDRHKEQMNVRLRTEKFNSFNPHFNVEQTPPLDNFPYRHYRVVKIKKIVDGSVSSHNWIYLWLILDMYLPLV